MLDYKPMKTKIFICLILISLLFTGFGGQVATAQSEPAHPRLYFSQEDLVNLRALQSSPSHQAMWDNIKSWADTHINDSPPSQSESYRVAEQIREYLETMGFMYAMTEVPTYADAAKNWMLSVSSWSSWGNYHNALVLSRGFAFGYDVLYNYFSPSERETIRNAMVTYIGAVYSQFNYPNFAPDYAGTITMVSSSIGLSGLALEGDYTGASDWIDFAIAHAERALTYGGVDGGWYEGEGYGSLSLLELTSFFDALKRVKGVDLFDNEFLRQTPYYYIYCSYNSLPLQFEDCNWYEGWDIDVTDQLSALHRLAKEYNDGYAQWLANAVASKQSIQSYIWKDPAVVATPPTDLPLTKHFRDIGYVIFRTGWGEDDLVFAFKSGSSRGHAHPSQNEFGIYYQGKPITCGPGYVSGEPGDDTWTHNCILVDGNGQGQEPGDYQSLPLGTTGVIGQIDVHDPYYRYVLGDAPVPYDGRLDKWLRHIVFLEPSYFVIYDEVAAFEAKQFDWLLQAPKVGSDIGSILVGGNVITLARDGVKLIVDVLEPASFSYSIISYNNPYGSSSYIKLHPSENASNVHFLAVHFPLTENDSALNTEKVSVGNAIGAKVTDGDNLDLILFSTDGDPVDEYIDLGGSFEAIDGSDYLFESNGVRVQFDNYQVLRLRKSFEVTAPAIMSVAALILIAITLFVVLLCRRRLRGKY